MFLLSILFQFLRNLSFSWLIIFNGRLSKSCIFISEEKGWSIYNDACLLKNEASKLDLSFFISFYPAFLLTHTIHYGSLNTYKAKTQEIFVFARRRILTVFHGDFGISSFIDQKLNLIISDKDNIDYLIVPNTKQKNRFISWGFPPNKLKVLPIYIDRRNIAISQPIACEKKDSSTTFFIGSFQKDGVGWEEGYIPKLIKGPDIFINTIEILSKKHKIHVLLVGPARGFVIDKLKNLNIEYTYFGHLRNPDDVFKYYPMVDLYLMCSREEGGPKAILECMGTQTPFIATNVGILGDLKSNDEMSQFIVESFEPSIIAEKASLLLSNYAVFKNKFIGLSSRVIHNYTSQQLFPSFAEIYFEDI